MRKRVSGAALFYTLCLSFLLLIGCMMFAWTEISNFIMSKKAVEDLQLHQDLESATIVSVNGVQGYGLRSGNVFERSISDWGVWQVLEVSVYNSTDTLTRCGLMGKTLGESSPALYLRDQRRVLRIGEGTQVTGGVLKLPLGKYEQAFPISDEQDFILPSQRSIVASKPYFESVNTDTLRWLKMDYLTSFCEDIQNLVALPSNISNSFFNEPKCYYSKAGFLRLENKVLKGKIMVFSKDSIHIGPSSRLQDVILCSPKVVVKGGGSHCAQIFADQIIVEQGARLEYPSFICSSTPFGSVELLEDSYLSGVLFAYLNSTVVLRKGATLEGELVAQGNLDLKGVVNGTVSCSEFVHDESLSKYTHMLKEGQIHLDRLPVYFSGVVSDGGQNKIMQWLE